MSSDGGIRPSLGGSTVFPLLFGTAPVMPPSASASNSSAGDPVPTRAPARSDRRDPPRLTIGELEAGYSLCCRALRRLIGEGRSLAEIQRTECWQRLTRLHACLPGQYKDPDYLYLQLRRQNNKPSLDP